MSLGATGYILLSIGQLLSETWTLNCWADGHTFTYIRKARKKRETETETGTEAETETDRQREKDREKR